MLRFPFWDPIIPLPQMSLVKIQEEFDTLAKTMFDRDSTYPPHDMYEEEGKVILEFAVAGFTKDRLKIKFEENVLKIIGEATKDEDAKFIEDQVLRMKPSAETGRRYSKRSIANRYFMVSYTLSPDINIKEIKSSLKDGMLRIEIPLPEHKIPKALEISIDS